MVLTLILLRTWVCSALTIYVLKLIVTALLKSCEFNSIKFFPPGNTVLLIRAYKRYVRPILDYCSIVWNPHHISDINTIEKVQKYFTRKILHSSTPITLEYLMLLGLEFLVQNSLELQHLWSDLGIEYKIVHNALPVNDFLKFQL